jgi:hypothetical protein
VTMRSQALAASLVSALARCRTALSEAEPGQMWRPEALAFDSISSRPSGVQFTPCSAAALRPEARAAARQSRDVSVSWSRPILEDWIRLDAGAPKKMMSPARAVGSLWIPRTRSRFTFLAACSGPPTVVRIPEGAERLRISRDLNRGEIF